MFLLRQFIELPRTLENVLTKPCPSQVLSAQVESEIVNWIIYKAETGSLVTKVELLESVQKYVVSLGDKMPTNPFTN